MFVFTYFDVCLLYFDVCVFVRMLARCFLTECPYVSLTNHAGVDCMIDESLSGRRVPPSEMEVAQDAVSVAYSLVQRHLASFGNLNVPGSNPPGGEQGPNAIAEVCVSAREDAIHGGVVEGSGGERWCDFFGVGRSGGVAGATRVRDRRRLLWKA